MFNKADKDGNGMLNFKEYSTFRANSDEVPEELKKELELQFAEIDQNADGEIDFEEFMTYLLVTSNEYGRLHDKVDKLKDQLPYGSDASLQQKVDKNMLRRFSHCLNDKRNSITGLIEKLFMLVMP
jgi:hypothetical protein